jgi:hypothetical protein
MVLNGDDAYNLHFNPTDKLSKSTWINNGVACSKNIEIPLYCNNVIKA